MAHLVSEEFQDKCCYAAIDADEKVDARQCHVGGAGDAKEKGGWVHQWGDGPTDGR